MQDSFYVEYVTLEEEITSRKVWIILLNWNSEKCGGIYFSHADFSTLVPKRITKTGWTLNLIKPAGVT